ncbi:putative nucleotide-diphospho-sugar transferase [Bacillus sp. 179-C3.3 HS]|uniref:putative nucleotide-diphospho-sugar transferase n=1 Tax=Bacillus sp. 179-C3.3 HS TaxID=3232162 RepID=UPI0039A3C429
MNSIYCTVLSKGRLYQAMAFFLSLKQVENDAVIKTLCMDDATFELLQQMNFPHVDLVHVRELETPVLLNVKKERDDSEYCWTLKPVWIEWLFERETPEWITYLDADLFFYESPQVVFQNQPNASVLLSRGDIVIPSFEPEEVKRLQKLLGRYNSGFIHFKGDEAGRKCLNWWKKECLKECKNAPGEGKFGDQGYLDHMPELFDNVEDIETKGVNIGHWNYGQHTFHRDENGRILIDDRHPLICYHFSGFRIVSQDQMQQIHEKGRTDLPFFQEAYRDVLRHVIESVEQVNPMFDGYAKLEEDDA